MPKPGNYAVIGTANKNEHAQGFFVKYGDGGADIQPIAHLFKTQVYQLARYLGMPEAIQKRTPTTDTYSAPATRRSSSSACPSRPWTSSGSPWNTRFPSEVAQVMGLTEVQVQRAFDDIVRKERTTQFLRLLPPVPEPPAPAAA